MTKLTRAIELRDTALQLLASAGTWAESRRQDGTPVRCLEFRRDGIEMIHRTRFQRVFAEPSDSAKYGAALLGLDWKRNLPYGLDIWAGQKVLNIEWDNQGRVELVSLKRGCWEQDLVALMASLSPWAISPCATA